MKPLVPYLACLSIVLCGAEPAKETLESRLKHRADDPAAFARAKTHLAVHIDVGAVMATQLVKGLTRTRHF